MSVARKRSKQRDSIQRFLETRTDHPTAETVYLHIREDIPNISLATVYRNLSLLADLGEVRKLSTGDGPDRFDPITAPHDHFICRDCGELIDMDSSWTPHMIKAAQKDFPGRIEEQRTYFFGVCPKCLEKREPDQRTASV